MSVVKLPTTKSLDDLPLQPTSYEIWDMKYRLKDKDGVPIDEDIEDTYRRVATALAEVEPHDKDYWRNEFLWALRNGAIPAGRIMSNAGADEFKPATSTINCVVSGTIDDSMEDILTKTKEAGLSLKAGCGIGYEFSTIRPRGAFVAGAGASTNGPLCFMDIFDKMCFTVSSAGGRRGAQMATFDVSHPDVMEFIKAKREDGRLRQFNCSVLITDEFMKAVEEDDEWQLRFPLLKSEDLTNCETLTDPITGTVYKIYETVQARDIWEAIMTSTYEYAEPGFILIDSMNRYNNNWFCEELRTTNPCGEQPLPPYGACLLGSVNLTKFVQYPFTEDAYFDWERYKIVVRIFSRMLDNVVEINNLPLEQQRSEIHRKRRHGMGVLGLGSAMAMLGIRYGDEESVTFTELVCKTMALEGMRAGLDLAKEKGPAPIMEDDFEMEFGGSLYHKAAQYGMLTEERFKSRLAPGQDTLTFKGKVLWAHSQYMQQVREADPALWQELVEHGCRYTHATSIAPTGTISLSLGGNASNGCEPSFSHHYFRNLIKEGRKTKEKVDVYSYELLAYRHLIDPNADESTLPDHFVTANDIDPIDHVKIQAAAQKWIDSSISKTANVPTDYPYEDFKGIYMQGWKLGLKGCTTFRFNPTAFQGVLVRQDDLDNTIYRFTLESGEVVECKGSDEIEYDGEVHTAANLFDGLKEGTYGKW